LPIGRSRMGMLAGPAARFEAIVVVVPPSMRILAV
jgi:hypothetical protein